MAFFRSDVDHAGLSMVIMAFYMSLLRHGWERTILGFDVHFLKPCFYIADFSLDFGFVAFSATGFGFGSASFSTPLLSFGFVLTIS